MRFKYIAGTPDGIQQSKETGRWTVHRVEASGCSYGFGPTREAALADWRRGLERRAGEKDIGPAVMPQRGRAS